MVRFKVIKGSHLLLGFAIIILALTLCALVVRYALTEPAARPTGAQASLVTDAPETMETKAVSAFVSDSAVVATIDRLMLDPKDRPGESAPTPGLQIEVIADAGTEPAKAAPRVLIYHTHTHEAYTQEPDDPYVALEEWRTADNAHNIVRVGEALTRLIRARGIEVVHDTTDHEQDELSTAYTRSLATLESYPEPFDLYIDLHRDAYSESVGPVTLSVENVHLARLMVLIGRGDNFDEKPYYTENYAFAQALTERLNRLQSGICREVLVKKNRYNQHIGVHSLLIEVGNNRNTLSEALASMPILADALAEQLLSPDTGEDVFVQLAADGK